MNVGMSSTVTASIRESVRDMAIGKIKSNEKADRATVEQSYIPKTLDSVKNVEEDVIWITSGKDTGDIYYKNIPRLHKALTKEDANAIEKPTDPGNNTKAGGSKSKSDTDVDEDSEGNESASETEVRAPVDKKAARKENQKKVKEEKGEARKN
ncbi:uncharacterized protein LOC115689161 [Syzygium oleosum]|uniref:uncharacterized protein LOC115689161 n=1 Tax=Syzygium oleosum TaxID=219896 RepID=UPI0024BA60B4|nr:uncharacterized protein LOC115689161 [Syzygium oleosum]XP_056173722.1 uncharacterized protein LOC115689161 [Syzygium oleosum]XP_056173723.1 uncharacterized protein LOC115689161 [Syzygium oleosum]XP_056173724.1 uncharacterized protein LOC115689161 [Syzygium oleosum]XP_056173725.1 uncharacterized protein LOC115689161 [Syzygium oleosum]